MRGTEIQRLLDADPLTEFAFLPGQHDTAVFGVRGLTSETRVPGRWRYSEVKPYPSDCWLRPQIGQNHTVASRDLVTLSAAQGTLARRRDAVALTASEHQRIERLVQRLDSLGVQARRSGKHIAVGDWRSLDALLSQLGAP